MGSRDAPTAYVFLKDLQGRLADPKSVQLSSDGLAAYPLAVESIFGADIDYHQLVRAYGPEAHPRKDRPPSLATTSHVERQNLNIRMGIRRFTRLTNAFSKDFHRHCLHVALYFTFYNFCRIHRSLRVTPAMAAGLVDTLHDAEWLVRLVEVDDWQPGPRGPYKKRGADTIR